MQKIYTQYLSQEEKNLSHEIYLCMTPESLRSGAGQLSAHPLTLSTFTVSSRAGNRIVVKNISCINRYLNSSINQWATDFTNKMMFWAQHLFFRQDLLKIIKVKITYFLLARSANHVYKFERFSKYSSLPFKPDTRWTYLISWYFKSYIHYKKPIYNNKARIYF